jgi:MATE family multidrug resistance protein
MKAFLVCLMALPFIFLFMWNALPIFRAILPQSEADPEILQLASSYLRIMSFAMPAVAAYECLRRYLQSFGLMNGPALAFAIASPVSIFLNWLLVHGPDRYRIGFLGAPLASTISYNLAGLALQSVGSS